MCYFLFPLLTFCLLILPCLHILVQNKTRGSTYHVKHNACYIILIYKSCTYTNLKMNGRKTHEKLFWFFFFLLLYSRRGAIKKNRAERREKTLITIEFVLQTNAIYFALGPFVFLLSHSMFVSLGDFFFFYSLLTHLLNSGLHRIEMN